ncbi:MAG: glycosyltransferase family 2 protein [Nitrospirota bacterium]
MPHMVDISIVIPLKNEQNNVMALYRELTSALATQDKSYEIIMIDDGSTDQTFKILKEIHEKDKKVKVIRFKKNFGQTAALSAGFNLARGEIIITMDGDLQNDPNDIPLLLERLDEGYDIVSGWRYKRKDPFISRRLPSMVANYLISLITKVRLHDYGCTLKAFRKDVIKNINLYGEMHRFIPAIASWMGVSVTEIKVNHRPRIHGSSKYGISRTLRVFLDLLTVKFLLSYSTKPIHIFGLIGLIIGGIGFCFAVYLAFIKLVYGYNIGNRPLLLLAILLIIIGVQFITIGLLAEIQTRAYYELQRKPTYVIQEMLE